MSVEKVIKLLAPDLTELLDLHPAQARQLQKSHLVEKIPSNSELILRIKSKYEKNSWPLNRTPEQLFELIKEKIKGKISKEKQYILAPITGDVIANCFTELEALDEPVLACVMDIKTYGDLRKFGRDILDLFETEYFRALGIYSSIWGAVNVSRKDLSFLDTPFFAVVGKEHVRVWSVKR
jgi:hypothetical protein